MCPSRDMLKVSASMVRDAGTRVSSYDWVLLHRAECAGMYGQAEADSSHDRCHNAIGGSASKLAAGLLRLNERS
jgi:hypothetical protein